MKPDFGLDRGACKRMMRVMLQFGTKFVLLGGTAVLLSFWLLACGRIGSKTAPDSVTDALQAGQTEVASDILTRHLAENPDDVPAREWKFFLLLKLEQMGNAYTLSKTLPEAGQTLKKALSHADAGVRAGAARLISERALPVPGPHLIAGLRDSDPNVRRYCTEVLGRRRDRAAVRALFQNLTDDHWYVRAKSAEALGNIGDPRATGWLLQMTNDRDALVRLNVATAVRQLAAESNQNLLRKVVTTSPQPGTQLVAALALAKLGDPLAVPPLIHAVSISDSSLRRRIAEALGDLPEPLVKDALTKLAQDQDETVKAAAVQALKRAGLATGL